MLHTRTLSANSCHDRNVWKKINWETRGGGVGEGGRGGGGGGCCIGLFTRLGLAMLELVSLDEGAEGERSEGKPVSSVEFVLEEQSARRQHDEGEESEEEAPGTQPSEDGCHADTRSASPSP
eukprot:762406-Hanusia_phi.AAC.2